MFDFVILISSFGSAITLLHFLHISTLSDSYIGIKTLTLFESREKKRGVLSFCLGVRLFGFW
jgi:hypothetical protein